MKRLVIVMTIISSIGLVSCSTPNYTSSGDYPETRYRYQRLNDPFFNGPGYYGNGYNNRGYYDRFNNGYGYGYRRAPYVQRRPQVYVHPSPSTQAPVRVRPINPRTDKWNPNSYQRKN